MIIAGLEHSEASRAMLAASGIPVVENSANGGPGKLVGIITNRDVRFASNPSEPVSELMTKENLVTVPENVDREEAKRLLHQHRAAGAAAPARGPTAGRS